MDASKGRSWSMSSYGSTRRFSNQKRQTARGVAPRAVSDTGRPRSSVAIEAAGELRVDKLGVRNRERRVAAIGATLVVVARWEDFVLRTTILADQAAKIAQ